MMGASARRFAERVRRRRGAVFIGWGGIALAVVVWVGLLIYWGERSDTDQNRKVLYDEWPTGRARTARYGFIYPENQAGLVARFLDRADSVESRVRQFLSAQPIPWIVADLTGSARHSAGEAQWKQVQNDLAPTPADVCQVTAG